MITVDRPALDAELARLNFTLGGYAKYLGIDNADSVRQQTRLFMVDVAEHEGPRSPELLERRMERDAGRVFKAFDGLRPEALRSSPAGEFVWTAAGPKFLVGVPQANYQPDLSAADMTPLFFKANGSMGRKFQHMDNRGNQHVYSLNRILVGRSSLDAFNLLRKKAIGKLRASFAKAWSLLRPRAQLDEATMAHIEAGDAKGTFIDGLGNKDEPSFTIISNSPGCSKPESLETIRNSLRIRIDKMVTRARYAVRKEKDPST